MVIDVRFSFICDLSKRLSLLTFLGSFNAANGWSLWIGTVGFGVYYCPLRRYSSNSQHVFSFTWPSEKCKMIKTLIHTGVKTYINGYKVRDFYLHWQTVAPKNFDIWAFDHNTRFLVTQQNLHTTECFLLPVYHVETPRPFISPLTLYSHVTGFF